MRALYFDCFAGASGDMICGALVDAGADVDELKTQLASLGLNGYAITTERVKRSGIAATKFNVAIDEAAQPHRHLKDIREIINRSALSELTKVAAEDGVVFAGAVGGGYVFPDFLPAYDAMASLCKLLELLAPVKEPLSKSARWTRSLTRSAR